LPFCFRIAVQDWTHNPMIAAHFVTDRPEDLGVDGAIWCVAGGGGWRAW
jgi:hypothetical protein